MSEYPDELSGQIDSHVTLSGIATDYKVGAAVVLDTGGSVLLNGIPSWPPELRGTRVRVAGLLRHTTGAESGARQPRRQKVTGERWWLDEPKIEGQP